MKNMKTTFPSSPKEITHPAMQCHNPQDRNPEQQACYRPDMSTTRMKTIPAPLNAVSYKKKKPTTCIILAYRNGGERHTVPAVNRK